MTGLGRLYFAGSDWEKARKIYQSLVLQNIDADAGVTKGEVYWALGRIHIELGQSPKAKSMFQRGLEIEPQNQKLREALTSLPDLMLLDARSMPVAATPAFGDREEEHRAAPASGSARDVVVEVAVVRIVLRGDRHRAVASARPTQPGDRVGLRAALRLDHDLRRDARGGLSPSRAM